MSKGAARQRRKMLSGRTHVVVDADTALTTAGLDVDDDLAVLWLLGARDVRVRALTAVHGNSLAALTCRGAHNLQAACGRAQIPRVACGGGFFTSFRSSSTSSDAVEALADTAHESGRPLVLLALGPLTTVAALLQRHPEAAIKIGLLILMGGSLRNAT
eukprot:5173423-Prymnesium_polylepis.2